MKVGILILFFSFVTAAQAQTAAHVSDLGWLAGCWESNNNGVLISEQWMKPAGGSMLGIGRTVKNGKTADFEFMRIEQNGGDVFYIARPKANNEETPFKLIRSGKTDAAFENLEHDFPQRVIYRVENTKLFARIEGKKNGKLFGIDFLMTRTKCY